MTPSWRLRRRLRRAAIAVAVASCFGIGAALANPTGPAVANGQVSIHQQGNLLQITNSPNAIINWQGFSIGANEITRFLQQSASSTVLNRVIGQNPSAILGALQSNGRVFLINPNGIVFGANAQIDVVGLVASTLQLSDADFLGGKLKFTEVAGAGSVVNEGAITTPSGGQVYLVGASVENKGLIKSPQGEVVLAAGNSVELVSPGTPNLRVEVTAPDNEAVNMGSIVADAGRVGIYAGLINHSGTIRADSAQLTADGRIVVKATQSATLEAGSVTTANGSNEGSVTVDSVDTTLVAGTIEAKGSEGKGGTVEVLGNKVGLISSVSIDVSGKTGGGTVLVGGDFQGGNPEVQNAWRTYVGSDTTIAADAVTYGNGGKVVVWSDDTTRYYGNISARGGSNGGDGGFAEVSGKEVLIYRGEANLSASGGSFGTLLLDPRDIKIEVAGSDGSQLNANVPAGQSAWQILFADSGAADFTLTAATVSGASANVVLQAQRNIEVNAPVSMTNAGVGFIAQAGEDIRINALLTTQGGDIHLEADSPYSPVSGGDGSGQVRIDAVISTRGGGATGGSITLIGGGDKNNGGFDLRNDVLAGTGGIQLSLSAAGSLDFGVGAPGATQLSTNDIARLKTTGGLVIGEVTTGGPDGSRLVPSGAQVLTVNSITNSTAGPIPLSPQSGSSFQLIAGAGGITLDRAITAFQDVVITTLGTVNVNNTINTTAGNDDLTINAGNLVLGPSGLIDVGTGVCSLNGGLCPGFSGPSGSSGLPPVVEPLFVRSENVLVSSTDQAVTPPAAISSGTEDTEEEKSDTAKKPVCTGGGTSQGATGAAAGVSFGGRRCTSRGCS